MAPRRDSLHRYSSAAELLIADAELESLRIDDAASAVRWSLRRTEPYELSQGIAAAVNRIAARFPDRIALEDAHSCLTYRELVDRFKSLALRLLAEGVGSGDVVAVGGERSAETVIGFLATQHLAAVYLPIPNDWPIQRTQRALADCRVTVLLFDARSSVCDELVKSYTCLRVLAGSAHSAPGRPDTREECGTPDVAAYIIYTSGSTGTPKGAVVERRGMMNHIACKVQDLQLCSNDVVAQTAPVGFDISVWQMLAPLSVGARVRILDDMTATTAEALLEALARSRITVLELVPAVLQQLANECLRCGGGADLSTLRWMLVTGEALPPSLARWWWVRHETIPLMNAYGPTECSDDVTHHVVVSSDANGASVPIGKPVGNTILYVLSPGQSGWRACRCGELGELFVGGVGVGRGYIGDAKRTRQAFFRDSLSSDGRVYRTGDLVRLRTDGVLEYCGRADRQAKIRGIRIELEEIEAVLGEHPAVTASAVRVARVPGQQLVSRDLVEEGGGRAERSALVAYVCLSAPVGRHELRDFLRRRLPAKVVPECYVVLPVMPRTSNGKTDYVALPRAESVRPELNTDYEPPVTDLERSIAGAWTKFLGIDRVGRHDAFLDIGGDSLVAMQVVSQLRRHSTYEVSFTDVLTAQTVAQLAATLEQRGAVGVPEQAVNEHLPDGKAQAGERLPLSAYQAGVYFQWRLAPENPYYTYQGMLRLVGELDVGRLRRTWNTALAENPQLLGQFGEQDGTPFQEPGVWSCLLEQPVQLQGQSLEAREKAFRTWASAEARKPIDLNASAAMRATLVRLTSDDHRILVTMHEILLDGWGATVFFARVAELYGSADSSPGAGGCDVRRYLAWESAHLREARIAAAAGYWRTELSGALPQLTLPYDRPRPRIPSYRGELVQHILSEREINALDAACNRQGATRFMVLLAAFGMVLTYYGNSEEVTIGAPIANRGTPEQAGVVAFLLNMIPLRLFPRLDRTCRSYLDEVRKKVLRGFAVSDYPFSWMLRELTHLSRSINTTPVFQVMLNVLNYPQHRSAGSSLTFEFVELESGFTKYECSLYAQPHGAHSLLLQLAFQTDLFSPSTASRMLESIAFALCTLGESPDDLLGKADLLSCDDLTVLASASQLRTEVYRDGASESSPH